MSSGELVAYYLDRLGATARGLANLHLAHLLAVPFENLSIHTSERIHLDVNWLFDKLAARQPLLRVARRRRLRRQLQR